VDLEGKLADGGKPEKIWSVEVVFTKCLGHKSLLDLRLLCTKVVLQSTSSILFFLISDQRPLPKIMLGTRGLQIMPCNPFGSLIRPNNLALLRSSVANSMLFAIAALAHPPTCP